MKFTPPRVRSCRSIAAPVPSLLRQYFAVLTAILLIALLTGCAGGRRLTPPGPPARPEWTVRPVDRELARRVEIVRTDYGVPHIRAETLRALGFGMAYCQSEDYGLRAAEGLVGARGQAAFVFSDSELVESDLWRRRAFERALETYHLLSRDTRELLEGFASGINYYMALHPEEFEDWPAPEFTGHDVSALTIGRPNLRLARSFVRSMATTPDEPPADEVASSDFLLNVDVGSNAWAFAPSRTTSGHAILVRNPHLSWTSGYYEAHLSVPGVLEFYGDIRVGGAFGIIGGFNERLGWTTTNNYADMDEIYELERDRKRPDHYFFDGASIPIQRRIFEIAYRTEKGVEGEVTRLLGETPLGPVIHETDSKIYVMRSTNDGEFRRGEQYLRMMQAHNLEEWLDAMRMHAINSSNYTYADADGNIFYVWNTKIPQLPHEAKEDEAVPASASSDIWTRILPFDDLPQLLNPEGGYLQNSNDSPYYTNLDSFLDPADFPANFPEPRLRLRSQHSLQLVQGERKMSLEDVVELKHSMRMLLADRVKEDLVKAVADTATDPEIRNAIQWIAEWDNSVSAESRGGVLFESWWRQYASDVAREREPVEEADLFAVPWSEEDPTGTPHGLARPDIAVASG